MRGAKTTEEVGWICGRVSICQQMRAVVWKSEFLFSVEHQKEEFGGSARME